MGFLRSWKTWTLLLFLGFFTFVAYRVSEIGDPYGPRPPTTPATRPIPYAVTPEHRKELVAAFAKLRLGMDAATVLQIMGTPDDVWGPLQAKTQQQKWTYYVSIQTPDGHDPQDAVIKVWLLEGKQLSGFDAHNMPELPEESFEPKRVSNDASTLKS